VTGISVPATLTSLTSTPTLGAHPTVAAPGVTVPGVTLPSLP
jgi:hypothetical protein